MGSELQLILETQNVAVSILNGDWEFTGQVIGTKNEKISA